MQIWSTDTRCCILAHVTPVACVLTVKQEHGHGSDLQSSQAQHWATILPSNLSQYPHEPANPFKYQNSSGLSVWMRFAGLGL